MITINLIPTLLWVIIGIAYIFFFFYGMYKIEEDFKNQQVINPDSKNNGDRSFVNFCALLLLYMFITVILGGILKYFT